jgi:hypothetical protein
MFGDDTRGVVVYASFGEAADEMQQRNEAKWGRERSWIEPKSTGTHREGRSCLPDNPKAWEFTGSAARLERNRWTMGL